MSHGHAKPPKFGVAFLLRSPVRIILRWQAGQVTRTAKITISTHFMAFHDEQETEVNFRCCDVELACCGLLIIPFRSLTHWKMAWVMEQREHRAQWPPEGPRSQS